MSKKDNAAMDAVLEYLMRQNRPYSVVDVFNNLHKEHGKTAVQKALEQLAADGKIKEKTYGKQKVYVADQSKLPAMDDGQLKEMDLKIGQLTESLQSKQASLKTAELELQAIGVTMTTESMKEEIINVKTEIEKLKIKLQTLMETPNLVSKEERDIMFKEHTKYVAEWKKRKRYVTDIIDQILEGYPKSKEALLEEVGIETDESAGVNIKALVP